MDNDPLSQLLADDVQAVDKAKLADFLKPFVVFDKSTKEMNFLSAYLSIVSNDAKLEVALVASKARALLFDGTEGLAPVEIIKLELMPEGSVKTTLKRLFDARKIKKDASSGKYLLPNYRLEDVISRLGKKEPHHG